VTAVKYTTALALALGLLAAPVALAAPSGSEYLPEVPKAPSHHSGGGGSTTTESSGAAPDFSSTQSSSSSEPARTHRRRPVHHAKRVKAVPTASVVPDSGESGVIIPVGLALLGAIILGGGILTRGRQKKQLKYQAEKRRRAEALEG
jgi:hypothetical protein